MQKSDIGIIGMAVMGQNLALNMESKGFSVSVYNRTESRTRKFANQRAKDRAINPVYSLEDFVRSLRRPRKVLLMVKAGSPVDIFLEKLIPLLDEEDIIIDGGNSHFRDTDRRYRKAEESNLLYMGTGISGGEYGALFGPCIMPGGHREAYRAVEDILIQAAARTEDGPCCSYLGPRSAGHFVKMVHNGIEYGVMQIIAESYQLMRDGLGMEVERMREIFQEWNENEMNSYLVGITVDILGEMDDITGRPLVDVILDKAKQKGTGKWTSQAALDLGVPVPTITAAVDARIISSFKDLRVSLSGKLEGKEDKKKETGFLKHLKDACFLSMLLSYTQGIHLLQAASEELEYNLDLSEIARIWKGGCIIRAKLLDIIKDEFKRNRNLPHLLLSDEVAGICNRRIGGLRSICREAKKWGIPTLALSASLNYYDSWRQAQLPANLIQAQRDYFGAHTYERVDREGTFHTRWQDT